MTENENLPATPDLDVDSARAVVDRIRTNVQTVWELIVAAHSGRAWIALGYKSWDDLCTEEFGTSRLRIPREERPATVCSLRREMEKARHFHRKMEEGRHFHREMEKVRRMAAAAEGSAEDLAVLFGNSGVQNGTPDEPAADVTQEPDEHVGLAEEVVAADHAAQHGQEDAGRRKTSGGT